MAEEKPAARIGDACVHKRSGGRVSTGCQTVLIGDRPAARVTDEISCRARGGKIVTGSTTVLVGDKPQARIDDRTNRRDVIAEGCPTVIVGGPVMADQVTVLPGDNFIECLYLNARGEPIVGALIEVLLRGTDTVLATGTTGEEIVRVPLPETVGACTVRFRKDPQELVFRRRPREHGLPMDASAEADEWIAQQLAELLGGGPT